jgi:hypothetical protein
MHRVLAEKGKHGSISSVAGNARLELNREQKATSTRMRGCLRMRRGERGLGSRQGRGMA